jgi:hypothetical protein
MVVASCLLINSQCRDPRYKAAPKTSKTALSAPRLRFRPEKALFDDIDAEISDREY